jgi:metallo-beta-lactamase class B
MFDVRALGPLALAALLAGLASACEIGVGREPTSPTPAPEDDLAARVDLRQLTPRVLVHTSYRVLPNVGRFPSNGLLVCTRGEGALVDSAWGEQPTARLLELAKARGCPVKKAVFTHSHDDRTGGLATLFAAGVTLYATERTTTLLAHPGFRPEPIVSPQRLVLAGVEAEVLDPGPAHAPDNVVVSLPGEGLLFGGCMIKASDAKTLGNVADASLATWPAALDAVAARYGTATVVVPGHGDPGGPELLAHTRALVAKALH